MLLSRGVLSQTARTAGIILTAALLSAAVFLICYYTDNKYTSSGPWAEDGALVLTERDLQENPYTYLVTGWEIHRGRLLTPEDFAVNPPVPDEIVFIGQYGGLEGRVDVSASPQGSATYRLIMHLPPKAGNYTLELPEIYSAYRLFINGELITGMGVPAQSLYRAETGNSKVSFRAYGRLEIIIAVSDYSHYYSGMVYPPAFGYSDAVEEVLNFRFALRAAALALSLGIGLLYLGVWLLLGKRRGEIQTLPQYYAALCFCFGLYICYPVVKTLWTVGEWWYVLESPAYPVILLLVMLIQNRISRVPHLPARLMVAFGVFVCIWSVSVPLVLNGSLRLMIAHSIVLTVYTWSAALYLLITSAYGAIKNIVHSRLMMTGAVVLGTACLMDRLLPMFEPIRFGWFSEISGGLYVALIGAVLTMEVAAQFRIRLQLEGRVESVTRMMDVQKTYHPQILQKEEELRAARHDFRHHMSAIRELASKGDTEKIIAYAQLYDERLGDTAQKAYCNHYIIDMLLRMYDGLSRRQNVEFAVTAALPETLPYEDTDLCVLLSNLLENALEASAAIPETHRYIGVRVFIRMNHFALVVENRFSGVVKTKGNRLLSGKQKGREGIGTHSVRSICARYGGTADFRVSDDGIFRAEIILPQNFN